MQLLLDRQRVPTNRAIFLRADRHAINRDDSFTNFEARFCGRRIILHGNDRAESCNNAEPLQWRRRDDNLHELTTGCRSEGLILRRFAAPTHRVFEFFTIMQCELRTKSA